MQTLTNCWKKLLFGHDINIDFEGFDPKDYQTNLQLARETAETGDVEECLKADEGDPGYQNLTEEEIAINVSTASLEKENEEEEEDEPREKPKKLSEIRDSLDLVINFKDQTSPVAMQPYYEHLQTLMETVIHEQLQRSSQLNIDSFFKRAPCSRSESTEELSHIKD